MRRQPASPPPLAERLLRAALPEGVVGDSIVGDAREEFAARTRAQGPRAAALWYWTHTLRVAAVYRVVAPIEDNVRKGRQAEMGTLWKDLKLGARSVLRMPGSAAISVVVLALGIGLCSSMFSIVYGLYLRGYGFPDEDRIVVLWGDLPKQGDTRRNLSIHDLADYRARASSFEHVAGISTGTVNLSGPGDEPLRYSGAFFTANTLDVLGVRPILGRGFAPGEDGPDAPLNVILGYAAWRDDYGMDRSVVGRGVKVNGELATVIGVMPEGFRFPESHEVWVPFRMDPLGTERGSHSTGMIWAKLREGVTRDQAEIEVASIARQLEVEHPELNEGLAAHLETTVQTNMNPQLNLIFGAMMVAVLCVLLVACANVANLLLARAAMRTREAGIRAALGGGRLRVMLPFFAEAMVLASAGALLGVAITYPSVGWFDAMTATERTGRPYFMVFTVDAPILLFVIGLTVFTALAAGLAPAFKVSRADVNTVLKDEGRGSSSLRLGRLSRALVTAEVALSCALLVAAGLMTKSIAKIGSYEYDYRTDGLFTARVGLFQADYPDGEARQRLWEELLAGLRALPGVQAAGLGSGVPHNGSGSTRVQVAGRVYADVQSMPSIQWFSVSEGYFAALGVEVEGRDFGPQDTRDVDLVAIVNQPMVDRYFDGKPPIGLRFRAGAADTLPWLTVVGVVPDLHADGLAGQGLPGFEPAAFYQPLRQSVPSFASILVAPISGDALAVTADVRGVVRRIDPDLPIYNVYTQAQVIDRSVWFYSVFGTVFIAFGLAALFMASVGLYGVLSFAVSRRTHEMGIRMALGAGARDVIALVARQGASQLAVGLGLGMALAFGITRLIGILMFEVDPQDPVIFGSVFLTIVLVGAAAAYVPARRATVVDPVEALRAG
ncbi:MAG TPA: ABC transporter permease [Longimicrobiales bacterium]